MANIRIMKRGASVRSRSWRVEREEGRDDGEREGEERKVGKCQVSRDEGQLIRQWERIER